MFEIIGLFLAIAFVFTLAGVTSTMFAGLVWLFTRKLHRPEKIAAILAALLIPIISAAYFFLCGAVLPNESLFGDISEPLPNGYVLKALGKMPDFAYIDYPQSSWKSPQLSQDISKVAVDGQLVVGQFSHPHSEFRANPPEPYFIFNTQTGSVVEFPTQKALQAQLGHTVALSEVPLFRSPLAKTQRRINACIAFGPPIIGLLLLIAFVWRCRVRISTPAPPIYT